MKTEYVFYRVGGQMRRFNHRDLILPVILLNLLILAMYDEWISLSLFFIILLALALLVLVAIPVYSYRKTKKDRVPALILNIRGIQVLNQNLDGVNYSFAWKDLRQARFARENTSYSTFDQLIIKEKGTAKEEIINISHTSVPATAAYQEILDNFLQGRVKAEKELVAEKNFESFSLLASQSLDYQWLVHDLEAGKDAIKSSQNTLTYLIGIILIVAFTILAWNSSGLGRLFFSLLAVSLLFLILYQIFYLIPLRLKRIDWIASDPLVFEANSEQVFMNYFTQANSRQVSSQPEAKIIRLEDVKGFYIIDNPNFKGLVTKSNRRQMANRVGLVQPAYLLQVDYGNRTEEYPLINWSNRQVLPKELEAWLNQHLN